MAGREAQETVSARSNFPKFTDLGREKALFSVAALSAGAEGSWCTWRKSVLEGRRNIIRTKDCRKERGGACEGKKVDAGSSPA
jgi:hypothetical protein